MNAPVVLLPRMSGIDVEHSVEAIDPSTGPTSMPDPGDSLREGITFAAVGGAPATVQQMAELQENILGIAVRFGFPDSDSILQRAGFDAACAAFLGTSTLFKSGEALRDDVWAYIATGLLAPVTFWRFGKSIERWQGGIRNTFQRLWVRARALDRGDDHVSRWGLLDALTEDAMVAITERTAIAAQRPLALAAGEGWLRMADRYGRSNMQDVMRRAVIAIRLRDEITALAILPAPELYSIVEDAFVGAANSLGLHALAGDEKDGGSE